MADHIKLLRELAKDENFPQERERSRQTSSFEREKQKQIIKDKMKRAAVYKALETVRAKCRQLDQEYLILVNTLAQVTASLKYKEYKQNPPQKSGGPTLRKYLEDYKKSNLSVLNLSQSEMDKINQTKLSLHEGFKDYEEVETDSDESCGPIG